MKQNADLRIDGTREAGRRQKKNREMESKGFDLREGQCCRNDRLTDCCSVDLTPTEL